MSGPALQTMSSVTTLEAPLHVFLDEARHHFGRVRFEEPANSFLHDVGLVREPPLGHELAETFMKLLGQFDLENRHIANYSDARTERQESAARFTTKAVSSIEGKR